MNDRKSGARRLCAVLALLMFLLLGCDAAGWDSFWNGDTGYELQQQENQKAAKQQAPAAVPSEKTSGGDVMEYEDDGSDPLDRPEGEPVLIWKAGNDGAIEGGGGKPPTVKQDRAYFVTEVCAYHWNNGKGAPAGEITLKAADGTTYGPWKTTLRNEVYWIAQPNQELPAGTYTLIDSDPSTWAQNSASGGKGMGWASGIPVN